MKPAENVEKFVRKFEIDINTNKDQAVLNELLEAQEKSIKVNSTITQPPIWRMIMKSKITKFTAAAVIIFGIISMLYFSTSSTLANQVDWADVLEQMHTVKSMSYLLIYTRVENPGSENEITLYGSTCREYIKDPDKLRRELLGHNQNITDVVIINRSENPRVSISL